MVVDTGEIRLRRAEEDIKTLRNTENRILDHLDGFSVTLNETRDIAADNRERLARVEGRLDSIEGRLDSIEGRLDSIEGRLDSIENRLDGIENRLDGIENRQKRMDDRLDLIEEIALGNNAAILEIRQIVVSIADSLDLTFEKPDSKD